MKLSIVVPVYNEKPTLDLLLSLVESLQLPCEKQILVVDDGSSDGSKEIAASHGSVRLISHSVNQGKGAAIRDGLRYADGEFVCIQDADMEYIPSDIPSLVIALLREVRVAVFGTRFATKPKDMSFPHYVGNLAISMLARLLYRTNITDIMTGYKLFPKEITKLGELDVANFGFEIEATARILKMGYRVVEVPIHYSARRAGKKITWADGLLSVYYLFKYRFRLKAPRLQFVADLLLKYSRLRIPHHVKESQQRSETQGVQYILQLTR